MIGAEISARYIRFAEEEARGRSPLYEAIARGVAADRDVIGFLSDLAHEKQQPNLLLAAVRHLFGTPTGWPGFRELLLSDRDAVRAVMQSRSTQTNEPARCATLLPVLARLPQPLALIEVGASAGLCLLPDHYGYDYGGAILGPRSPTFRCAVNDAAPVPVAMPRIVWRVGLDLNPLDAADASQVAWLETLVWPEQTERLANLRAALRVAVDIKPRVVKGDLTGDSLAQLAREAPSDATLVVFHTAVLAYVADLGGPAGFRRARDAARHLDIERDAGCLSRHCQACRCARPGRPLSPGGERYAGRLDRPARRFARLDRSLTFRPAPRWRPAAGAAGRTPARRSRRPPPTAHRTACQSPSARTPARSAATRRRVP